MKSRNDDDVEVVTSKWVYAHLICEFDHYDICLTGLVDRNGERWFCECVEPFKGDSDEYTIRPVAWNEECTEYLEDYKAAYKHWFWENGKRPWPYEGWDLKWFADKWKHRNPIRESAIGIESEPK